MKRSLKTIIPAAALLLAVAACSDSGTEPETEWASIEDANFAASLNVDLSLMEVRPSGLYVQTLVPALDDADDARNVDIVTVHYEGYLVSGSKFDSSRDRGQPFQFMLGAGDVIPGWDEGLISQKIGEVRRLIIPPQLAYRLQQVGSIPPNSILVFDVELLGIQ